MTTLHMVTDHLKSNKWKNLTHSNKKECINIEECIFTITLQLHFTSMRHSIVKPLRKYECRKH